MPILESVQKIQNVACRLRQNASHSEEVEMLDEAADKIIRIVMVDISSRERQIYDWKHRFRATLSSVAPWKPLSEF